MLQCLSYNIYKKNKVHERHDMYYKVALSNHGILEQLLYKNAFYQNKKPNKCNHMHLL